jgi:hypothetical protein
VFASREAVLREAERSERIAANYRRNLAVLDDPGYTPPRNPVSGEPRDDSRARECFEHGAENAAAKAAELRRLLALEADVSQSLIGCSIPRVEPAPGRLARNGALLRRGVYARPLPQAPPEGWEAALPIVQTLLSAEQRATRA